MMINKSGDVCYRSKTSQCQKCMFYLKDYVCWYNDYISYKTWENIVGYECNHYKSILSDQLNSHFIHRNYEDKNLFPEKKFGEGKYRFNSRGEKI